MKMKKIKFLIIAILISSFNTVFAGDIDYFEVKLGSQTAKVGEALDLTITAMDRDNNIVDDYLGTILVFSETDPKAELPSVLNESSYTFTLSDAGSVKFENAIIFNSSWKQDLHVYDLNDDTDSVAGIVEVEINKAAEEITKQDIEITSPESGSTLTTKNVTVAGQTVSNHRVIVTSNWQDYEAISNSDGVFEVSIDNQKDGDLIISAAVVNADSEEIGRSQTLNLKINASAPVVLWVKATPQEGYPKFPFNLEVVSEPGLELVEVNINDSITALSETESWKYVWSLLAPEKIWSYSVNINLQNSLGVKSENPNSLTLKVIEEPKQEEELDLDSAQESEPKWEETEEKPGLKIEGLKLTKLKTKSILEWTPLEDADFYMVYVKDGESLSLVEKVDDSRITIYITWDQIRYNDFVVRAIKEKYENGNDLEWDLSEAIKIQTWPEKYIFLILIALFISLLIGTQKFIYRR